MGYGAYVEPGGLDSILHFRLHLVSVGPRALNRAYRRIPHKPQLPLEHPCDS